MSGPVLMASVFAEILRAWSGQARFIINYPVFHRLPLHPQIGNVIGDTTATMLLAADKSDGTFAERAIALQRQLWVDLEHRHFTGVQVLRELTRARGEMAAAMPIVMTSLAGHPAPRHQMEELAEPVFSISQTPQVAIDFQLFEIAGEVLFNWDYLPGLFPDGLVEAMFAAYCAILARLAKDPAAWNTLDFGVAPAPADGRSDVDRCLADAVRCLSRALPVVDIGCGTGQFTRAFASRFAAAVGVDISPDMIRRAQAESAGTTRVSFRVMDATRASEMTALAEEIGDSNVFVRDVLPGLDDAGRRALAAALAELAGDRGTVMLLDATGDVDRLFPPSAGWQHAGTGPGQSVSVISRRAASI